MNFVRFDKDTGRIHGWGYMLPAHVIAERDERGGILLLENFQGQEPDGVKVDLSSMTLVPDDTPAPAAALWSSGNTRLLSIEDADAIRAVVLSRQKLWTKETLDAETYAVSFDDPAFYVGCDVLGYFENNVLDAIRVMTYPRRVGFAGDPCAVVSMNMTMARAGREKKDGWDVNNTRLLLAMCEYLAHRKIWTRYHVISSAFNAYHANPAINDADVYDYSVVETIPAGKRASGPERAFINKFVATRAFAEETVVRKIVMRPEKRPS